MDGAISRPLCHLRVAKLPALVRRTHDLSYLRLRQVWPSARQPRQRAQIDRLRARLETIAELAWSGIGHHTATMTAKFTQIAGICDPDGGQSASTARAAYHDPTQPERTCAYCGSRYHGPAVYCLLDCALADA